MTQVYRDRRLQCATANVSNGHEYWDKMICSEEKWFTLSGPDGMAYYWHNKRCKEKSFRSRKVEEKV